MWVQIAPKAGWYFWAIAKLLLKWAQVALSVQVIRADYATERSLSQHHVEFKDK